MNDDALVDWWHQLLAAHEARADAAHRAYQSLENQGLISKVTVHRYLCQERGEPVLTVIRLGDDVLARSGSYKLSPGLNSEFSVPSARERNTLDGDRHWPGGTYDVGHMALGSTGLALDAACRHRPRRSVPAADVLDAVRGVRPGHPIKPTRL